MKPIVFVPLILVMAAIMTMIHARIEHDADNKVKQAERKVILLASEVGKLDVRLAIANCQLSCKPKDAKFHLDKYFKKEKNKEKICECGKE